MWQMQHVYERNPKTSLTFVLCQNRYRPYYNAGYNGDEGAYFDRYSPNRGYNAILRHNQLNQNGEWNSRNFERLYQEGYFSRPMENGYTAYEMERDYAGVNRENMVY